MNSNFFINTTSPQELKRELYIDNFLEEFEKYSENIFYDDVIEKESLIEDIFEYLKTQV